MAPALLVVFPLLLLVAPRFAWLAIAVAIVLLVNTRLAPARPSGRRHVDTDTTDASI
jgi:hypothetical protein